MATSPPSLATLTLPKPEPVSVFEAFSKAGVEIVVGEAIDAVLIKTKGKVIPKIHVGATLTYVAASVTAALPVTVTYCCTFYATPYLAFK